MRPLLILLMCLAVACSSQPVDVVESTVDPANLDHAAHSGVDDSDDGADDDSPASGQVAGRQLQQNLIPRFTETGWQGAVLPQPVPKPDFTLTDTDGQPFDFRADTADAAITFLYFGYTTCPDICPLHMAAIATALRNVPDELAEDTEVIFVSVDPARDEPIIREYLDSFDASFTGLIGTAEEVNRIMDGIGLIPSAIAEDGDYPPSHPVNIIAFAGDDARLAYPTSVPGGLIAEDLTRISTEGPPA